MKVISLGCLLVGAIVALGAPSQPQPPAGKNSLEDAYRANNIGVAYLEQFNYEAAIKSFQQALAIEPSLGLARINLAIALYYAPDLPAAAKEAEAATTADPKAPQPPYLLGLIAKSENRVDDGVKAFEQVLAIDDRDLGARVNLAQLHMQRREYDRAVALLRPAVEAEPYHVTALYNLGVALTRSGKAEEGQKVMAQFQKLREGGYGTTFSNNYLEQGRYAEAIASTGAEPGLVDDKTPDVSFAVDTTLPALPPPGATRVNVSRIVAALGAAGSSTLADLDRDGDLDLIDVTSGALRVFSNEAGTFQNATGRLGLEVKPTDFFAISAVVGDYDNDERPDLFVTGLDKVRLLRQTENGRLEDRTAAAQLTVPDGIRHATAFVDVDHDGDLDIFMAGLVQLDIEATTPVAETARQRQAAVPNMLFRNNGNGTFTDIAAEAGLQQPSQRALAIVPTDFDNRRDVDLLIVGGGPLRLMKNLRDGTFADVAEATGLVASGLQRSVTAGDVNKDGFTDFYFGQRGETGALLLSDGRGAFRAAAETPGASGAHASQLVDYDNDGLLDLVALSPDGLHVWRNTGPDTGPRSGKAWRDVTGTAAAGLTGPQSPVAGPTGVLSAGDVDLDGDVDLIAKAQDRPLILLENRGGNQRGSIAVRLTGRVSNRSAVGSKVELRAGSLRQRTETYSATPAVSPADLVFGIGTRTTADVVRILWPSGILQAEFPGDTRTLTFTELDRKPSSCPYLFTWNGTRFEFLTDFMGGGEMGYTHAPGIVNTPDPEEYTRIPGGKLKPRDDRYELRITNELEEALFIDRLQLVAVDHPAAVEIHPREGLFAPPFPDFRLYAATGLRPPVRALDHRGEDVLDCVSRLDRQHVDELPKEAIRGYAKEHMLTLDLGAPSSGKPRAGRADLLLLTGWTDYAFSSDNIAASQAGLMLKPPVLQVRDARGAWQTVVPEIGIPVGRPQTVVVDLTGKFLSDSREVRIVTSMRVYWDQILVGSADRAIEPRLTHLAPVVADLRWRGFSAEVTPDGREPFGYDYTRVSPHSPWKVMPGRYTREGDVRELLGEADDFFVVSRPGDEIALAFDARSLPPLPAGWTRTFLLHSVGYSKEMDRNSASPDHAWPLPFGTMTRYPYVAPESYPDSPAHRAYQERWNTRVVGRPIPPIELAAPERP